MCDHFNKGGAYNYNIFFVQLFITIFFSSPVLMYYYINYRYVYEYVEHNVQYYSILIRF